MGYDTKESVYREIIITRINRQFRDAQRYFEDLNLWEKFDFCIYVMEKAYDLEERDQGMIIVKSFMVENEQFLTSKYANPSKGE